jgi:hypothetical protein
MLGKIGREIGFLVDSSVDSTLWLRFLYFSNKQVSISLGFEKKMTGFGRAFDGLFMSSKAWSLLIMISNARLRIVVRGIDLG